MRLQTFVLAVYAELTLPDCSEIDTPHKWPVQAGNTDPSQGIIKEEAVRECVLPINDHLLWRNRFLIVRDALSISNPVAADVLRKIMIEANDEKKRRWEESQKKVMPPAVKVAKKIADTPQLLVAAPPDPSSFRVQKRLHGVHQMDASPLDLDLTPLHLVRIGFTPALVNPFTRTKVESVVIFSKVDVGHCLFSDTGTSRITGRKLPFAIRSQTTATSVEGRNDDTTLLTEVCKHIEKELVLKQSERDYKSIDPVYFAAGGLTIVVESQFSGIAAIKGLEGFHHKLEWRLRIYPIMVKNEKYDKVIKLWQAGTAAKLSDRTISWCKLQNHGVLVFESQSVTLANVRHAILTYHKDAINKYNTNYNRWDGLTSDPESSDSFLAKRVYCSINDLINFLETRVRGPKVVMDLCAMGDSFSEPVTLILPLFDIIPVDTSIMVAWKKDSAIDNLTVYTCNSNGRWQRDFNRHKEEEWTTCVDNRSRSAIREKKRVVHFMLGPIWSQDIGNAQINFNPL